MNTENRGPWYLLTGLLIGLVVGVLYAWRIQPVQYVDTAPDTLRADYKDRYRALIAQAYVVNGDLLRARARLELLKDPDLYRALAEQAQRTLAEDSDTEEARALGLLAVALGQAPGPALAVTLTPTEPPTATPVISPSPGASTAPPTRTPTRITRITVTPRPSATLSETDTLATSVALTAEAAPATSTPSTLSPTPRFSATPTETPIPRPTQTSAPTSTPSRTPGAPFVLETQEQICGQTLEEPLVQVEVEDSSGQPVAGAEVIVTWGATEEEHFFTGLKPELGLGYADFTLTPGRLYSVRIGEGGQAVSQLTPVACREAGEENTWGAWRLVFVQP